jgi:hypothetical protein
MTKSKWIDRILREANEVLSEKQGPCWDGYERVPGTKEYTKGSCRKKEGEEERDDVIEETDGLWANIHKKRKAGKRPAKRGEKGYPSDKAWKELTEGDEDMDMEEGNAFIDAASKAASRGQKTFTVDGETYPTRMSKTKGQEIQSEVALRRYIRNYLLEAIYDGKKVELNKPTSNPENPNKKSKVYVNSGEKYKSGEHKGQIKAKKVQFGDPNMRIKKSNPKARKSFRLRHDCANKTDNKTAGYWSCKAW